MDKIKTDYKFCGDFETTINNMGMIGEGVWDKNLLLFISCKANGTINSISGVEVIDDILRNKSNCLIKLFSPKRDGVI